MSLHMEVFFWKAALRTNSLTAPICCQTSPPSDIIVLYWVDNFFLSQLESFVQISDTDFTVPAGTAYASMKGLLVWWAYLTEALLNAWRSTVLLGSPLSFGTTTILEHHVTSVLMGTLIKSLHSFYSQCRGIATGVWTATGLKSVLVQIGKSSNLMSGKVCLVHLLNAEEP